MAHMSKLTFTLSGLIYLCSDKTLSCEKNVFEKLERHFFYEMIVMGILE